MPSVLTLNIAAPPRPRARALLEWLWHRPEDLWVLTEAGVGGGSALVEQVCRTAGFTVSRSGRGRAPRGHRGVLIVGRGVALTARSSQEAPPAGALDERIQVVTVSTAVGQVEVIGVYGAASDPVRHSSSAQRARKRAWLAAFGAWLADRPVPPSGLLVGDLNIVDPHDDDPLPFVLAEELALYRRLTGELGWVDAWRSADTQTTDVSWVDHSGVRCRYDHALVSADLAGAVEACELVHEPRLSGLTDHSALTLTLPG